MRILQNTLAWQVGGVSFGPAGRHLIAGGSGGYDVWDLATGSHTFVSSHRVKYLYGCVYDPLGRWAYVSDHLGGFRLLPLGGDEARQVPGSPHERHVTAFDLTPSGEQLVMNRGGGGSNRVECWAVRPSGRFDLLWSIRDGQPVDPDEPYLINSATWFTNGVAVVPDGKIVGTAESRSGGKPLVVLRDGITGRVVAELGRSEASFQTRLAFAPDGRALFTWDDRVVEKWDTAAGRLTGRLPSPGRARFRDLAIHPTGRLLVTVSGDGQARYWDLAYLALVRTFKWQVGKLHAVAISADGALAAAGGDKGKVVVWDVDG